MEGELNDTQVMGTEPWAAQESERISHLTYLEPSTSISLGVPQYVLLLFCANHFHKIPETVGSHILNVGHRIHECTNSLK